MGDSDNSPVAPAAQDELPFVQYYLVRRVAHMRAIAPIINALHSEPLTNYNVLCASCNFTEAGHFLCRGARGYQGDAQRAAARVLPHQPDVQRRPNVRNVPSVHNLSQ